VSDKAKNVIICDDIRQEANGKYFLIGVYPWNIVVSPLPANIPLSTYIEFEEFSNTNVRIELEVRYNKKIAGSISVDVEVTTPGASAVALPRMPIPVGGPGELTWHISVGGKKMTLIKTLKVLLSS